MINYADAMDEINEVFVTKWKAEAPLIVGYVPEVRFANVEKKSLPDGSKFWARIYAQTVDDGQATLSTCEGKAGQRKFTSVGNVFVQLFCPKSELKANEFGQKLAMIGRNAYRKKSTNGGVWFKNSRIQEQPQEDLYYHFNIVCEFEYDELG